MHRHFGRERDLFQELHLILTSFDRGKEELGNCKQDLPKKVGVAAHAVILRKPLYLAWVISRANTDSIFTSIT
jgi:hypothetical protein